MKQNLKTNRLNIKPISIKDLGKIHDLHSLPETDQFNTLGIPKDINETEKIIAKWISNNKDEKSKNFTFKIELKEKKLFIGLIALNLGSQKFKSAEVWYKLHSSFWNKGYGTETLQKILEFGFNDLKLHRIEAGCAVDNIGSIRILEKVGMIREGRKGKVLPLKNGWSDNFEFAILSTDNIESTTHNNG